jgi:UTP pyrophosphatase
MQKQPLSLIAHYPLHLQQQVQQMLEKGQLERYITQRYPETHNIQTDKALFNYCNEIKQSFLKNAPTLDKVKFDSKLGIDHYALGLNKAISKVQGGKLKAKKEINIASVFKTSPTAFLKMITVHELAHLKVRDHDKAFYQLCMHMEPNYHQYEFDCRVYLMTQF